MTSTEDRTSLWRTPGVLSGMIGMLLLAIAVMTPGFTPARGLNQIPGMSLVRGVLKSGFGHVFIALGVILLFRAWLLLRPARAPHVNHALVLALWAIPALLAPPIFSTDAFLYADQGWTMHLGKNPYEVGLSRSGGPFAVNVHPVWQGTTAVYPPLALEVQHLVAWLTGFNGLISVIAMRIPALLAVAIIAWAVPRFARDLGVDPTVASWFAVLNPLMLIHFVGGMHNDAWMLALVLLAAWLAVRYGNRALVPAAILVGLGAGFKQPGILAAIAIGLLPVRTRLKDMTLGKRFVTMLVQCAASVAIACATFAALTWVTGLGYGWIEATKIHERTWGMSPASVVEQVVYPTLLKLGMEPIQYGLLPQFTRVFTGLSLLFCAYLAWRYFFADKVFPRRVRHHSTGEARIPTDWDDHPLRWMAWAFAAIGLGGAGFHAWYLMWGGLYLGMLRYSDPVFRLIIAGMIMFLTVESGVEYFSLRPLPGYLLGAALGWMFWTSTPGLRINRPGTRGAYDTATGHVRG
ncbi:hypothetical protein GCM10027418_24590 [Mariniluteicoccus endophyticus]